VIAATVAAAYAATTDCIVEPNTQHKQLSREFNLTSSCSCAGGRVLLLLLLLLNEA
jgi:hypothetical protein